MKTTTLDWILYIAVAAIVTLLFIQIQASDQQLAQLNQQMKALERDQMFIVERLRKTSTGGTDRTHHKSLPAQQSCEKQGVWM